jgi:DNA-binding beta-propeller fold protein YncE
MHLAVLAVLSAITLPTGWRIEPAGALIETGTFPTSAHLLPGGGHVLILHSGYHPPTLAVLDLKTRRTLKSLPLPDAGSNFVFDAVTQRAWMPLGHDGAVAVIEMTGERSPRLHKRIALDAHVSTVALDAGGRELAATLTLQDTVAIVDTATGTVRQRLPVRRPTRALFHAGRLYVTANYPPALHVFRTGQEYRREGEVPLSADPTDLIAHGGKLYVAASGTNGMDVLSLEDPAAPKPLERIHLAPSPYWPVGMTPSSLSLDTRSGTVYIACSDANAIAVFDIRQGRVAGFIPAAWYPTYALPLPDRAGVLVLNGKGERSYPNPRGPNPAVHRTMTPQPPSGIQYTPLMQGGSLRLVEGIDGKALARYTRKYAALTPVRAASAGRPARIPQEIRHVILIMKENRTYDQVLGDMPEGRGEASLCLFPEKITPNHHKLARDFGLLDNFYVNADVSAEGWYWTSAAIAPYFVMRSWPASYAGRAKTRPAAKTDPGDQEPQQRAPGGYLWTGALRKGIPFRNYGFFVQNRKGAKPGEAIVEGVSDPALLPHTHPAYAGYDPDFPDVERARIFIEELEGFEKRGEMPRLITMVLPNDHTWGTSPGKLTPFASVADNDLALGRIVEAVSKTRFWPRTAIFVVEDDAQNGPDHVDSHRSPAFVISPWTRRARTEADSTFYNTTSVLRTIGLILGLPPLTHYDATATPMASVFRERADARPWSAEPARVSLSETNPARSATARRSEQLDLSAPDRIEDAEMNEILWLAVKGVAPPPPTRAGFLTHRK